MLVFYSDIACSKIPVVNMHTDQIVYIGLSICVASLQKGPHVAKIKK